MTFRILFCLSLTILSNPTYGTASEDVKKRVDDYIKRLTLIQAWFDKGTAPEPSHWQSETWMCQPYPTLHPLLISDNDIVEITFDRSLSMKRSSDPSALANNMFPTDYTVVGECQFQMTGRGASCPSMGMGTTLGRRIRFDLLGDSSAGFSSERNDARGAGFGDFAVGMDIVAFTDIETSVVGRRVSDPRNTDERLLFEFSFEKDAIAATQALYKSELEPLRGMYGDKNIQFWHQQSDEWAAQLQKDGVPSLSDPKKQVYLYLACLNKESKDVKALIDSKKLRKRKIN